MRWIKTRDYEHARRDAIKLGVNAVWFGAIAIVVGIYLSKTAGIVGGALLLFAGVLTQVMLMTKRGD
ncbi:hypothetical protein SAJA_14015 [Salinisphaera japonica YTM-1]|uniref:Uncharacterized protein n=1 Tax=Salinisphaera japonica YTM-1 TaxID=1209778 RepID=A0A423PFQ0_9GAMM|nr:hypothetical protein SAJA_14015 [Salinisphaera japonica YTM-1]